MLGGAAGFFPAVGADFAELGTGFAEADVAADEVRFLEGDVKGDAFVELQRNDFADTGVDVDAGEAAVDGDAVLEVDDVVAFDEFGEVEELIDLGAVDGFAGERGGGGMAGALAAEEFGLGEEDEGGGGGGRVGGGEEEAFVGGGADEMGEAFFGGAGKGEVGGEEFAGAVFFGVFGEGADEGVAGVAPVGELGEKFVARLFFGGEAVLREEVVGGVTAVVAEAFEGPVGLAGGGGRSRRAEVSSRSEMPWRAAQRERRGLRWARCSSERAESVVSMAAGSTRMSWVAEGR